MNDISIYIHFPWCIKKCPYCDFNSHEGFNQKLQDQYLKALINDIEYSKQFAQKKTISTIFLGGGTPSLFSGRVIAKIIDSLSINFNLENRVEITIEANPGTLDQTKIADYQTLGINRLSLGIQSFNDRCLQRIGRIHNAKEAIWAIESAAKTFNNINLDLMFGLPSQTFDDAKYDISLAAEFDPSHLSYYELTIEPNTFFYNNPPSQIDQDLKTKKYQELIDTIQQLGFDRYEVSAYVNHKKSDHKCRHNQNYWRYGDYIGIGAGAHSKITNKKFKVKRMERISNPLCYIKYLIENNYNLGIEEITLPKDEIVLEFVMNAFRLKNGFGIKLFETTTGIAIDQINSKLLQAQTQKLIKIDTDKISPTEFGFQNLNFLNQLFVN